MPRATTAAPAAKMPLVTKSRRRRRAAGSTSRSKARGSSRSWARPTATANSCGAFSASSRSSSGRPERSLIANGFEPLDRDAHRLLQVEVQALQRRAAAREQHAVDLQVGQLGLGARDHQRGLDQRGELTRDAHDGVGHLLGGRIGVLRLPARRHVGLGDLHLLGLAGGGAERLLDGVGERRAAGCRVPGEEQLAALLDRDVEVLGADVHEEARSRPRRTWRSRRRR